MVSHSGRWWPRADAVPAALAAAVSSTRPAVPSHAGALTAADRGALSGLAGDPDWTAAVAELDDQPRALFAAELGRR